MAANESDGRAVLDTLVLGLAEFLLHDQAYPYPNALRQAWNQLALALIPAAADGAKVSFPRTIVGFLSLMERPVREWFPCKVSIGEEADLDLDVSLLYDGRLSEEANRYLYEELLERPESLGRVSPLAQQIALDNRTFQNLLERLRDAHAEGSQRERAQRAYVLLRSFPIEHSYATGDALRKAFSDTMPLLSPAEVGRLYETCTPNEGLWVCERCGPLTQRGSGQLRGIRPSVCDHHHPDLPHVRRLAYQKDLRRVKVGIHWRVTLPGIPEMQLYRALEILQREHPAQLQAIHLWPGVDRYDLRLLWGDGAAWAVDVKDRANPCRLGGQLGPIYGEGDELRYVEAFYVVPERRTEAFAGYLAVARAEAQLLTTDHHIVSMGDFEERVVAQIARLKKGNR